jgi:hypothetical protein
MMAQEPIVHDQAPVSRDLGSSIPTETKVPILNYTKQELHLSAGAWCDHSATSWAIAELPKISELSLSIALSHGIILMAIKLHQPTEFINPVCPWARSRCSPKKLRN